MVDLLIKGRASSTAPACRRSPPTSGCARGASRRSGASRARRRGRSTPTGWCPTPGFIDVHTHYDAQLDWDPIASPSSWHGVTTVLAGNCGFTLAPARFGDSEWLAQMLSRVEGMSVATLTEGLRWKGGGFGEFWRRLEGRLGVNAGGYVGHSAVRRHVMGDEASQRPARADEIGQMQELVRQAMREGALGFSSSQLDIHVAHDGREVPSNFATPEELIGLCAVLAEFGRGAVEFIPRSFVEGYNDADRSCCAPWRASPADRWSSTRWCRCPPRPTAGSAAWRSPATPSPTACVCTRCSPPTSSAPTSPSTRPSCSTRCRASAAP
ncbi:MAG: amidohydrolase family protein [Candidatus Binatia bacterium]